MNKDLRQKERERKRKMEGKETRKLIIKMQLLS